MKSLFTDVCSPAVLMGGSLLGLWGRMVAHSPAGPHLRTRRLLPEKKVEESVKGKIRDEIETCAHAKIDI